MSADAERRSPVQAAPQVRHAHGSTATALIQRNVEAQVAALERGDSDLAELLADHVAYIINVEWHQAHYWRSIEGAIGDYEDREHRLRAAIRRAGP